MARDDPQLKLRLSPQLKLHIVLAAQKNNRSVNAEIVDRLQKSVDFEPVESDGAYQRGAIQLGEDAFASLEQKFESMEKLMAKESRYQDEVVKWLVEQQKATNRLLEHIASTNGHLSPDFLEALRALLAQRGADNDFPRQPDEDRD